MGLFMIACDNRDMLQNPTFQKKLGELNAARLMSTIWMIEFDGDATAVHVSLNGHAQSCNGFVVIEIDRRSTWSTHGVSSSGLKWLRADPGS
ncbi:MAG: hypothetical protein FJX35_11325 [Alphaproteobacteria bacterium]|nr:hypothetical protein [Alphaproteobacteria bacterium]